MSIEEMNALAIEYAENAQKAKNEMDLLYWLDRAEFINYLIDKEMQKGITNVKF